MPALTYSQINTALGSYKEPGGNLKTALNQVIPRLYSTGIYRDLTIQYLLPIVDGCITLPKNADSVLMFQLNSYPAPVRSMWHDFKAAGIAGTIDPTLWGLVDAGYHATSMLLPGATTTLYPVASVYDTNKAALNYANFTMSIVGTDSEEFYLAAFEAPVAGVAASATLNPTGTNNNIVVSAISTGTGGNLLTFSLAVNSTTDRTQLTAVKTGNDIVVTSGDKRRMLVSANFGTGVENHVLTYVGIAGGSYQWNNIGTVNPIEENAVRLEHAVNGTTSYLLKIIDEFGEDSKFSVTPFENPAGANWPDDINWSIATPDGDGATGTPTVTASAATAAQAIAVINANTALLISAANAAANDGTGAIAAVAATPLTGGVTAIPYNRYTFSEPVTLIDSIKFTQTTGTRIVDLRTTANDPETTIATLGPENTVSRYRRYRIPSSNSETTAHVLVKRAFEPIVNDSDLVYISNLAAIKHGLLALIAEDNADLERASFHWNEAQKNMEMEMESARGGAIPSVSFDIVGMNGRSNLNTML